MRSRDWESRPSSMNSPTRRALVPPGTPTVPANEGHGWSSQLALVRRKSLHQRAAQCLLGAWHSAGDQQRVRSQTQLPVTLKPVAEQRSRQENKCCRMVDNHKGDLTEKGLPLIWRIRKALQKRWCSRGALQGVQMAGWGAWKTEQGECHAPTCRMGWGECMYEKGLWGEPSLC